MPPPTKTIDEIHSTHLKSKTPEQTYDYFLKTGSVLFDYYDNEKQTQPTFPPLKSGNVLSFIQDVAKKEGIYTKPTTNSSEQETLMNKYLDIVEPNFNRKTDSDDSEGICSICKVSMLFSPEDATFSCPKCGNLESVIIGVDSTKVINSERISTSVYKTITHFREQLQESKAEISHELYKKLEGMFIDIQEPYKRHRINEKNMMNYNFLIYKMLELLGEDSKLKFFKLSSESRILAKYNIVWKLICRDLKWEFIRA
jgi:predicted RNA-binding Zn-ribbon protein involved in translation (DUF1610 family)